MPAWAPRGAPPAAPPLVLLRVASRAWETLAPLRADRLPALAAWRAAEREAERARAQIGDRLFALAGPPDAARPERPALLALRRELHQRRDPRGLDALAPVLGATWLRHIEALRALERECAARWEAWRQEFARHARAADLALVAALDDARVVEALRLVGAALPGRALALCGRDPGSWSARERHVASKLLAYVVRFATKTSPHGLFCATALARVGGRAAVAGGGVEALDLQLNVGACRAVTAVLARDPALRQAIVPRPNTTLRREGEHWSWWRPASGQPGDSDDVLLRARHHPALAALVTHAGALAEPELLAAAARDVGVTVAQLEPFFRQLVERGALVAEPPIAWSERAPLLALARHAGARGAEPAWLPDVQAVAQLTRALPAMASPDRRAALDRLTARFSALPHARPVRGDDLVRVDARSGFEVTLPAAVVDEVASVVRRQAHLYAALYPGALFIERHRRRFLAMHPADTDVALLDWFRSGLEPEPPSRPSAFPALPDGYLAPAATAARAAHARMRDWMLAAARAGADEVAVDEATWSTWIGATPAPRFACAALFQVAARDVARLNAGEWRVVMNALYPGVGLAVSRLAWLHPGPGGAADSPIARDVRAAYAGRERAGAVLAEISFMHGGRTANAGLRPPLLTHEILLLGDAPTPGHVGIALSDLALRWDSADARFVLRSHALGCEIVPVLTSGVSPEGLASFLVAVGRQGEQPVAWFPGFDAPEPMRWPRVVTGRTVLFRRRWSLAPPAWAHERDPARRFAACDGWRECHGLPAAAFVHSSVEPKPFAVDLGSPPAVAALAAPLRALPATAQIEVTEMLPGPDDSWVADPEGRHASEFLIHVHDERPSTVSAPPVALPA